MRMTFEFKRYGIRKINNTPPFNNQKKKKIKAAATAKETTSNLKRMDFR